MRLFAYAYESWRSSWRLIRKLPLRMTQALVAWYSRHRAMYLFRGGLMRTTDLALVVTNPYQRPIFSLRSLPKMLRCLASSRFAAIISLKLPAAK